MIERIGCWVAALALLAGCGSDEPTSANADASGTTTVSTSTAASGSAGTGTAGAGASGGSGGSGAAGGAAAGGGGAGGGGLGPCVKRFGDAGQQAVSSVATDASGNVVVTGGFPGVTDFGGGPLTNAYVAKFDASCNHVWSKAPVAGSAGPQYVVVDPAGNVVLVGGLLGGTVDFGGGPLTATAAMYAVKLDPSGNHVWSKKWNVTTSMQATFGAQISSVAVDGAGNILLVGWLFEGSIDFGNNPIGPSYNAFLAKLDPDGAHLWSMGFGATMIDVDVAVDAVGDVLLGGRTIFAGGVDFGGGALLTAGSGIFAAKLDPSGNHIWSKGFDADTGQGPRIAVDPATQDFLLFGQAMVGLDLGGGVLPISNDSYGDIYLARFDENANHVWSESFFGSNRADTNAMRIDGAGDLVLTGSFLDTLDLGGGPLVTANPNSKDEDGFLAKLSGAGAHVWSRQYNAGNGADYFAIATDVANDILLAGRFSGAFETGMGALTSAGAIDGFLIKYPP